MYVEMTSRPSAPGSSILRMVLAFAAVVIAIVLIWQGVTASGNPDPLAYQRGSFAGVLDIAILVFREGLECILVLSAITASMVVKMMTGYWRLMKPSAKLTM